MLFKKNSKGYLRNLYRRLRVGWKGYEVQIAISPITHCILKLDKSLNLNAIAENFDISRQAISLHIKILNECGMIKIHAQGRERYCEARLDKLSEVSIWVEQYHQHWEKKLDALENYLDKLQKQKK